MWCSSSSRWLETHHFWGLEYFEEARGLPFEKNAPGEDLLRACLSVSEVSPALVPNDCADGFGTAFWSRPEAYLEADVQNGMSWIACLPPAARAQGTAKLAQDLGIRRLGPPLRPPSLHGPLRRRVPHRYRNRLSGGAETSYARIDLHRQDTAAASNA